MEIKYTKPGRPSKKSKQALNVIKALLSQYKKEINESVDIAVMETLLYGRPVTPTTWPEELTESKK